VGFYAYDARDAGELGIPEVSMPLGHTFSLARIELNRERRILV